MYTHYDGRVGAMHPYIESLPTLWFPEIVGVAGLKVITPRL